VSRTGGPRVIDLNCDLGEGCGEDEAVLPFVTSASIACGLHAGDAPTMRRTIAAAARAGVTIGAHPSFPDREGFGRRPLPLPPEELFDHVLYQIGALTALARAAGVRIGHVKPHGALYHEAHARPELARAVALATRAARGDLVLVGFPGGALAAAAGEAGLRFAAEGFVDRAYGEDGALLRRGQPGAILDGDDEALAVRAVDMIEAQAVFTTSGRRLPVRLDTLCLHGDDPRVVGRARALRAALARAGIRARSLAHG
jgi:5-oxoprolinase (ATP-hydrolysing) subunit A